MISKYLFIIWIKVLYFFGWVHKINPGENFLFDSNIYDIKIITCDGNEYVYGLPCSNSELRKDKKNYVKILHCNSRQTWHFSYFTYESLTDFDWTHFFKNIKSEFHDDLD